MEKDVSADVERFLRTLRETGFRLTTSREAVARAVFETTGEAVDAQTLWDRAQRYDPAIGIATVYRTVNLLSELGLLHFVDIGDGFRRFEPAADGIRLLFVCAECGASVTPPDEAAKTDILAGWCGDVSFLPIRQTVRVLGVCGACASSDAIPERPSGVRGKTCCRRRRRGGE